MKEISAFGRELRTCGPDDRLSDAARIMWENDCGCLLVVAESDPPTAAGILTDRDICMAACAHARRLDELRVGDAMSTEVEGFDFSEACALAETTALHGEARTLALLDRRGEVLAFLTLFTSGAVGGARWRCLS